LATTDVMLASTVQFSRYGRSRWPRPCGAGLPVLDRGETVTAVPSGPNSVLGLRPSHDRRPFPPAIACATATGCTNRNELVHRPNNQCSTSEHPP